MASVEWPLDFFGLLLWLDEGREEEEEGGREGGRGLRRHLHTSRVACLSSAVGNDVIVSDAGWRQTEIAVE